jgi:hypothetical protein
MNIELIIQDSAAGNLYDISQLASDISWETEVSNQPGKLSFTYQEDPTVIISEGSIVSLKVDNKGVFFGYIFKKGKKNDTGIPITAYDQMRYLKNQDTYVISGLTASQLFSKVCKDFQLRHNVVNESGYVLADRVYDNKSLFDIIDWGITETMAYTSNWYMIRDNFGTIEFVNLNSLKTDLFIGDKSLLTDYDYESSIDDDTYNQVKLVKENKNTQKREVYIVKDSSTISKWGLLQYFETVDEEANESQIKERAEQLLKLKNRVTKKLSVTCIGDLKVFAGCGIVLGISDITDETINNKYYMVTKCTHNFKNNEHTMSLDLQVSI